MMCDKTKDRLPQAVTNLAVGSYRVKAPVAGAGPVDSGGGGEAITRCSSHQHRGKSLTRTASENSLASGCSYRSAFSDATVADLESSEKYRQEVIDARKKEVGYFDAIDREVEAMVDSCKTQKGVNYVIKEGLKKIQTWMQECREVHAKGDSNEDAYHRMLAYAEEARISRKKIRSSIQGQLLRNAVIESSKSKRDRSPASSPEEWKKVQAKRARKTTGSGKESERPRSSAAKERKSNAMKEGSRVNNKRGKYETRVLIRIAEGQSYASVLGVLRKEVDPDTSRTTVLRERKTQSGDLILQIGKESDTQAFTADVGKALKDMGVVRIEERRSEFEIRDIDSLTDADDARNAVAKALGILVEDIKATVLGPNRRGDRLAVVNVREKEGDRLLNLGHIKIGMMSCRIRRRIAITRCYRCLGYGHVRAQCEGADRSNICYRCGEAGHCLRDCQTSPRCVLCVENGALEGDVNHVSGSGRCSVFRKALQAEKHKSRWKADR